VAGLGWLAFLFAIQRSLLFPAPIAAGGDPGLARLGGERLWLEHGGGRTEAWLLPALPEAPGPAPLVLFAHGNGELIDHWLHEFAPVRHWGVSVLLVEYPGYGRSGGSPSQAAITQTMVAAYDVAVARPGVDPQRIVGWGRSLGGGAVCALAQERALAALVLESTFTSVKRFAARFGLPGFLVRDPFDNLAVVREFPGPLLVVHGERDDLIPPAHARALHAAAKRALLHWLPCAHNDCPRPWDAVRAFLAQQRLLP
jgi:fermentation-respiration switch protein FrsA (DUF1100 family)